ncbi:MAG: CHAT domain-containing protein [Synergistaceae bacterium]|nr:CHAT domain-containing protein [Synergistaceae bacterium]
MEHGAALLHTIVTERRLWVILTTPEIQLSRESKVPRAELYKKITAFREALEGRGDILPAARELYDIIIAPIAKDLEQAKARTLMFSLDGQLRYIPIAALYDGEKWLAEKYAVVVYTEAAKDKLTKKTDIEMWELAGLGVTAGHPGFDPLPAVRGELEAIVREEGSAAGIPGVIYMDEKFVRSTLSEVLDDGTPVVHVASHFSFNPGTVADSFLLLGDGDHLTLEDINTGAFTFKKVDQLTFSACNTAMGAGNREGAGREVEGLGVLAQKRGAKSVMATLWGVADNSTGIFMSRFYTLLLRPGMTKAEALRQTQVEFIEGKLNENNVPPALRGSAVSSERDDARPSPSKAFPGYRHPFYWAPFILMGNWL